MAEKRTLTVPARFDQLARISDFVTQAARDAGFGEDDVFHIQMAVDEACANIVEHAYGPESAGDIGLTCSDETGGELRIEIRDHGRPFNPDGVPVPKIGQGKTDLDELQIGGLGLYFMRKLMDEVTFEFSPEIGNRLTMIKRRPR
jgi:serine/threonine-protein kinase RsbW